MAQPIKPGSTYTVQSGDTLWDIAQRAYADPEDWDTIYNANKQVIGNDPNLIKPGQVLHIPTQSDPSSPKPTPTPQPQPKPQPINPPDPNLNPYPSPVNPTPTPPPTPQPTNQGGKEDDNIFDQVEDNIEKELGEKKDD